MKKKFNQELLNEELKKFRLLSEYAFYQEKDETPEDKDLILGTKLEEADEDTAASGEASDISGQLGLDAEAPQGEETPAMDDAPEMEPEPTDEPAPEMDMAPEGTEDVEVDVTQLVKGSEEAKQAADTATKNTELLLQKLTDLETKVSNMDAITNKIEGLENEIIKRNPTPVEKLEMRSLSSYPFNLKLTDYWSDKEGQYDVMGNKEPKEYVLTKDDVDSDYSDGTVKKSFGVPENPYEEEDMM